jgi:DNA adenine methylase
MSLLAPVADTVGRVPGRAAPLLKWPGGKGAELDRILPLLPDDCERYYEPFVGGGAVWWTVPPTTPALVNDTSGELIDLYRYVRSQDADLLERLDALDGWWTALTGFCEDRTGALAERFVRDRAAAGAVLDPVLLDAALDGADRTVPAVWAETAGPFRAQLAAVVPRKYRRMRAVEVERGAALPSADVRANLEGAVKAAAYTALRGAYNAGRAAGERSPRQAALFLFLREFAYAAMFRFNRAGQFNVPYGGVSYNRKRLGDKVAHLRSPAVVERLTSTVLGCGDFEAFLERHPPTIGDVVFVDPPYDSDFSEYDRAAFGRRDHARLADVLRRLPCRFVLVVKATPAVRALYADSAWTVRAFDKRYTWTIKERNDRRATHLLISNGC